MYCTVVFFFFQAEDGIRDTSVTGVQTCALPILVSTGLDQSPPDIDLDPLRAKYRIADHLAVSCTRPTGISDLQMKIAKLASGLRMMEERWPPTWVKAAEGIRSLGKPHVPPEELFQGM